MNIGYHSDFMDRIIERADKRQERMEKMINKMLDKSEAILQAGKPQEQTNEEWFASLSTEEKAEALTKVVLELVSWNNDPKPSEVRNILKAWLKQPPQRRDKE